MSGMPIAARMCRTPHSSLPKRHSGQCGLRFASAHILLRMFSRRVSFPVCRHLVRMPGLRVSSRTTF